MNTVAQKKIMIIGAGEMQTPVILKAKELGFYVITIDVSIIAPGNKYADLALEIDTNEKIKIFEAAQKYKADGILTTSDYPVRAVAYVCKELGLSSLTESAAELCTNKFLLRDHLKSHNFIVPKYHLIDGNNFDLTLIDYFPVIVKPVDSSASRGVSKVQKFNELGKAINFAKSYSRANNVIVEEFIEGNEYSVETFTQNGITNVIAITEKTIAGDEGKFFVEDRHLIHADLTESKEAEVKTIITNVVNSLELGNCPTHTEIKINEKGVYVIEIGARLGGDFIASDLVQLATGIDMLENLCKISLNEQIDIEPKFKKFAGIQFINSDNYYRVSDFLKSSRKNIFKSKVEPFKDQKLQSSLDRLGYFIAQTESRWELTQLLDCK